MTCLKTEAKTNTIIIWRFRKYDNALTRRHVQNNGIRCEGWYDMHMISRYLQYDTMVTIRISIHIFLWKVTNSSMKNVIMRILKKRRKLWIHLLYDRILCKKKYFDYTSFIKVNLKLQFISKTLNYYLTVACWHTWLNDMYCIMTNVPNLS